MRFPIIRTLPVAAFFLLISAPVQAQLSKEVPRVPRIADISDLAFEPSGPFAGAAAPLDLSEGWHFEYQVLDAKGKATTPAGTMPRLVSSSKQRRPDTDLIPVTVPAGTFSCYAVASPYEQSATPRPGLKVKSSGRQVDYYDPAVGLIKTDYYDSSGKLLQSRVLRKLR
ncbi:MAG: hypothetical protein JWP58_213 [Hymenobacter sp.]|nr:hypothetical protein [Hymenobacter sp.]